MKHRDLDFLLSILRSLRSDVKKNNNEPGRTQNELMLSEFVPVRFSSLFFSCSFMNHNSWPTLQCLVSFNAKVAKRLSKSLVFGGYHEIFKNKKPQIPSRASEGRRHVCPAGIRGFPLPKGNRDADKRGFMIAYLRSFAFICGFIDTNKHQQILLTKTGLYGLVF